MPHVRATFKNKDVEKIHAVVARNIYFQVKINQTPHHRATFGN